MSGGRTMALVSAEGEEFFVDREDVGLDLMDGLRLIPSVHTAVEGVPVELKEYFV